MCDQDKTVEMQISNNLARLVVVGEVIADELQQMRKCIEKEASQDYVDIDDEIRDQYEIDDIPDDLRKPVFFHI